MHDGRDPLSALPPLRRSGAKPAAGALALPGLQRYIAHPKRTRGAVQEEGAVVFYLVNAVASARDRSPLQR